MLKAFVVMNTIYFAAFTTIVLTTRFNQPVTPDQFSHLVLTSLSLNNFSLQANAVPPTPPDRGAPSDRRGAATYNK